LQNGTYYATHACGGSKPSLFGKLERWGRSIAHYVRSVQELVSLGIRFLSLTESIDTGATRCPTKPEGFPNGTGRRRASCCPPAQFNTGHKETCGKIDEGATQRDCEEGRESALEEGRKEAESGGNQAERMNHDGPTCRYVEGARQCGGMFLRHE